MMMARPEASLLRQGIDQHLQGLRRLVQQLCQPVEMIRGSFYLRRRRCGRRGCRCQHGELHQSFALSVRKRGQSQMISLAGVDRLRLRRQVDHWRRFRHRRSLAVKEFKALLSKVDALGDLEQGDVERLCL